MPRILARCHEIASPSRSGSVARNILSDFRASLRMEARISPRPRIVIYLGSKSCSTSTPICDLGRSRMCPCEASTLYPLPRNLEMVFALAGDSTMMSFCLAVAIRSSSESDVFGSAQGSCADFWKNAEAVFLKKKSAGVNASICSKKKQSYALKPVCHWESPVHVRFTGP